MWRDLLYLLFGLALLVFGGNWVTDGGSSIARRFHMSGLLVGLTVIAFGSSTPDLVISVFSTVQGKPQLAIGDVVGANIFDLLLVIGVIAMIAPIKVQKDTLLINLPVCAFSALLLFFCADDVLIDGTKTNILNRSDGLVMLCSLAIYMTYMIRGAIQSEPLMPQHVAVAKPTVDNRQLLLGILKLLVGLGSLVVGGNWFVDGASGLAEKAGWSDALVGLTVVAIGSSMPDLATSVMAALKKEPGIALGNIIGGCIYNVLLVLGTCSVIHPLSAGDISQPDFLTLLGAALLLWIFASWGKRHTVNRWEGAVLIAGYAAYMTYLIVRG